MRRFSRTCFALLLSQLAFVAHAAPWHHPFYLSGGGWWRGRVRVEVRNEASRPAVGEPVAVRVGRAAGEADLAGHEAQSLRVCDEQGTEMLWALTGPDGESITCGPIPAASSLILPAECEAGKSAVYYVYFGNPAAGEVPDFLQAQLGVVNGDVERGTGEVPAGWVHDSADETHKASWSTQQPQSGKRCLKTVVAAGAEPTWIATRQSGIRIQGGAKYRMKAWVRAENVEGFAGWYIHVGDRANPMMISPMLGGGAGTYGWKEVAAEFTAPADANLASLGTVLRGTGTAWFDNVRLECLEPQSKLHAVAGAIERVDVQETEPAAPWPDSAAGDGPWDRRVGVRVFNFSGEDLSRCLVCVDGTLFEARLRGPLGEDSLRIRDRDKTVPHTILGSQVLFAANVPARSVQTYRVYYGVPKLRRPGLGLNTVSVGTESQPTEHNLVKNPGFEEGNAGPSAWTSDEQDAARSGVTFGLDDPRRPGLGRRCARMHVPTAAPQNWRGWRQSVPVKPGRTYLLSAWVKCQDVVGGEVRVHAHCHTKDGQLCKQNAMMGVGPGIRGTTDWTLMSGLLTMPSDAATLQLHLTMQERGTLWHDKVTVAEVVRGEIAGMEGRPVSESDGVKVWPVPAVVKVFEDDPAPPKSGSARISAARNEQEPLQVAVRSGQAVRGVRVEVPPLQGRGGAMLNDIQINLVGFVPIDYPTNYYQTQSPPWHRKFPTQPAGCDGWPGRWPDPLLPRSTFDLAANTTQPVWITVSVPTKAPAGDYAGKVRLAADGKTLAEVPFTLRVWDFALPEQSHMGAIYDVGITDGGKAWNKPADEVRWDIIRFMAKRRLCPDRIPVAPKIRYENGRVVADFTEFDRAGEIYFNELKLPFSYTPWNFYLFGWGFPPGEHFGEHPYPGKPPYEGADRSKLRPEFTKAYQACLKAFWDHVAEKGWQDKFVLYISDEPFDSQSPIREQMKALCAMIHEVDPKIPIYSSTWKHVPEWDGFVNHWGFGHYGIVPPEVMAKRRAAGDRIWFTTDGQMCTDTPLCAVERLLPHYCFKYDVQVYEFWGAAWTTYDPFRFGWHSFIHQSDQPGKSYYVRYPNGDGYLLYPGPLVGHSGPVSSVRLEQAREGVEDYEYLYLLKSLIGKAKVAGKNTSQAEAAMEQASRLVTIPNAGGRYSSKILPEPEALYRAREAVATAIEGCAKESPRDVSKKEINERRPWIVVGRVTDERGLPIEGATVRAHCGYGTLFQTGITETGKDGRYTLRFAPGVLYFSEKRGEIPVGLQAATISVSKPGYVEKDLHRQGNLTMANRLPPSDYPKWGDAGGPVLPGKPVSVDFVLVSALSIDGELLDAEGKPIAGKDLCIGGKELPPSSSVLRSGKTDAQGRFQFENVPPGYAWWFEVELGHARRGVRTPPLTFPQAQPYHVRLQTRRDAASGLDLFEVLSVKNAKGEDVRNQIVGDNPLTRPPLPPELQAKGREILAKMSEANRYWLDRPPSEVRTYRYDFKLGTEPAKTHEVPEDGRVPGVVRQEISYSSVLNGLKAHPEQVVFRQIEVQPDKIILSFTLTKHVPVSAGNGVLGMWRGFFSRGVSEGTMIVDPKTFTLREFRCEQYQETLSDYAEVRPGHFVPLRVRVSQRGMEFDFRFRVWKPGLWLFASSHRGPKEGKSDPIAQVENVLVNGHPADVSHQAP